MISHDEFIAAAKIVEAYHSQMSVMIKELKAVQEIKVRTLINDYPMGDHLKRILSIDTFIDEFADTIHWEWFRFIRNAGKKTWKEFEKIREQAKNDKKAEINRRIAEMCAKQETYNL